MNPLSFFFIKPKMISFPFNLFPWGVLLLCEEFSTLAKLFICSESPFVLAEKQAQEEKEILPQLALLPYKHIIDMRFCHSRAFLVPKCPRHVSKKSAGCSSSVSLNFLMSRWLSKSKTNFTCFVLNLELLSTETKGDLNFR